MALRRTCKSLFCSSSQVVLKPSSYQYNDLDDNLEDEDNLYNEVYLWYEDFLKDEDDLVNEVYLWYEDFLDNLDNEVYLWYEDFLEDEDNLDNEVFCDTKTSLKTKMS